MRLTVRIVIAVALALAFVLGALIIGTNGRRAESIYGGAMLVSSQAAKNDAV